MGGAVAVNNFAAIRFSALGDIATTIPYLHLLDNPLIVTSKIGYELLKDEFDRFHIIDPGSWWQRFKTKKLLKDFMVIDFQNNRKSRSMTKGLHNVYNNTFLSIDEIMSAPIYKSYEKILARAGIDVKLDMSFKRKELTFIVLNMGSSPKWLSKRLPKKKWIEFSKILWDRFSLPFVLTGDKGEVEYVSDIARELVGKVENVVGKTSLQDLKKILKEAYLVVSTDSAAMHIAAVQKTPTIGLFGATNWILSRPFGPWSVAIYDKILFPDGKPFAKNKKEIGNYYEHIDLNDGLEALEKFL